MKKLAIIILITLAMILLAMTVLIKSASAEAEADPVGLLPGEYTVIWIDPAQQSFELQYDANPGKPWKCRLIVMTHCTESDKPAPKVNDKYYLAGNQKFFPVNGKTQELRWDNTIYLQCWAYIAKLAKCPPCPVCPAGAGPECAMCAGTDQ